MTLVLCPECRSQISTRASRCPQCGYPLTGEAPAPAVPAVVPTAAPATPTRPSTYITTRFALTATLVLGFGGIFAMAGMEEEGFAAFAGIIAWGSLIPVWWKARRKARTRAAALNTDVERRLEERLKEIEERFRTPLAQIEDGGRQIMEIEERMDFLERLMTKVRDDQRQLP